MNQLCPNLCSLAPLKIQDFHARAEALLVHAEAIDCRKYVTAKSIVSGNPKLNVAFIAHLFNMHPGLAPLEAAAQAELDEKLFGSMGDREARGKKIINVIAVI